MTDIEKTHVTVFNRSKRSFVLEGDKTIEPGSNRVPIALLEKYGDGLAVHVRLGTLVVDQEAPARPQGPEFPAELAGLRVPDALKLIARCDDEVALRAYAKDPREKVADAALRRLETLGKV